MVPGIGLDLELEGVKVSNPGYKGVPLEVGKGQVLREGTHACLLGYGTPTNNCLKAAKMLEEYGIRRNSCGRKILQAFGREVDSSLGKGTSNFGHC